MKKVESKMNSVGSYRLLIVKNGDDTKFKVDFFTESKLIENPHRFDELQTQRAEIIKEIDKVVCTNLKAFENSGSRVIQKFLEVKEHENKIYLIVSNWRLTMYQLDEVKISIIEKHQDGSQLVMTKSVPWSTQRCISRISPSLKYCCSLNVPSKDFIEDFNTVKFFVRCSMFGNIIRLDYVYNDVSFLNDYEIHLVD